MGWLLRYVPVAEATSVLLLPAPRILQPSLMPRMTHNRMSLRGAPTNPFAELVEGLNERMKAFLIYRRRYGSTGSPRTAYVKAHHERLMLKLTTNGLGIDSPLHYVKY